MSVEKQQNIDRKTKNSRTKKNKSVEKYTNKTEKLKLLLKKKKQNSVENTAETTVRKTIVIRSSPRSLIPSWHVDSQGMTTQ